MEMLYVDRTQHVATLGSVLIIGIQNIIILFSLFTWNSVLSFLLMSLLVSSKVLYGLTTASMNCVAERLLIVGLSFLVTS